MTTEERQEQSATTKPLLGVVVVKQSAFGILKVLQSEGGASRVYFSAQDCTSPVNVGQRVSFELKKDPGSGKPMATKVTKLEGGGGSGGSGGSGTSNPSKKVLSPEPSELEIPIEGRYTGVVQALPKAGETARVDDGMLSFIDLEGRQQQAMFGRWRMEVSESAASEDGNMGAQLELGQPVLFTLAQNPVTKELKANAVRVDQDVLEAMKRLGIATGNVGNARNARNAGNIGVLSRGAAFGATTATAATAVTHNTASTATASSGKSEFGKVVLLKKEFGFLKRMFESGDLFFHFSELDASADPTISRDTVNVGDELEFTVHTDDSGRACARDIKRAPPGSAQFEVIGDEIFHGVVLEKPALGKSYEKTPGVIDFVAVPLVNGEVLAAKQWASAPKTKMLFYPNESEGIQNLRPGSHVAFRILTDVNALKSAKMAGKDGMLVDLIARRAVKMHPIRGEGVIVDLQKMYGFLTWSGSFMEGVRAGMVGSSSSRSPAKSKQHRLFFSRQDLDKSHDFNVGDVVYFVLQSTKSSDDMAAGRLKKSDTPPVNVASMSSISSLATLSTSAVGAVGAMGLENLGDVGLGLHAGKASEPPARRKPLKLKKPSVAQPRIPDGTRGFTMPRGAWLREADNVDEDKMASMCCGFRLRGVLLGEMPRNLSAEAIPFEMRL